MASRMRRSGFIFAFALLFALASPSTTAGTPPTDDEPQGFVEIDARAETGIRRGLDYLAAHQNPDGSWTEMIGRKVNETYVGHMGRHVGVTAIACASFLSNGSVPGEGPYGQNIERGVEFVLSCVTQSGFITCDESRMYSHAFATLFLAEVYGMTRSTRIRDRLQAAIDCIVAAQNYYDPGTPDDPADDFGAWRYLPGAKDSDISITVCQIMALRAARNAGVHVPARTIQLAMNYVRRSHINDPGYPPSYRGGFWYQIYEGDNPAFRTSRTSFALTAAGVASLYGAGEYDSDAIRQGLDYMWRNRPQAYEMRDTFDYFYGHYYAVQAFYQAGGRWWERWYPFIRDQILDGQNEDGSWRDLVGPNYATAMATIILQVPYRYLPILER